MRRGLYDAQLQNWLKYVDRENILLYLSEGIFDQTAEVATEITNWVGGTPPSALTNGFGLPTTFSLRLQKTSTNTPVGKKGT